MVVLISFNLGEIALSLWPGQQNY